MVVESDIYTGSFMTFPFFSDRESLHFTFSRKYGKPRTEVTGSPDNEELYLYRNKYSETYEAIDSMHYELTQWRISRYGEEGWPEEGSGDYAFMAAAFDSINAMHGRITEVSGYDKWLDDRLRNHKSLAGLRNVTQKVNSYIQMLTLIGQTTVDSALLSLYMEYREVYPDSWLVQQTDAPPFPPWTNSNPACRIPISKPLPPTGTDTPCLNWPEAGLPSWTAGPRGAVRAGNTP